MTAPRVVISRHSSDMSNTGKLHEAADRKCKPDHEGDVLFLENDTEQDCHNAEDDCRDLRDPDFVFLIGLAAFDHRCVEIVADGGRARQSQPRHDRKDGGEGDPLR